MPPRLTAEELLAPLRIIDLHVLTDALEVAARAADVPRGVRRDFARLRRRLQAVVAYTIADDEKGNHGARPISI
jgi:hypothetical protein